MGDPRNPARADELWNQKRIDALDFEIHTFALEAPIVISGGWAWHYMSPPHEELKLHHDHKDLDIFIAPKHATDLQVFLKSLGYQRVWTRFDNLPRDEDHPAAKLYKEFFRFENRVDWEGESVKVIIDIFVGDIESIEISSENLRVVEPVKLLSMYRAKSHTTDDCTAVIAARELQVRGEPIVGNPELVRRRI